MKFIHTADLHLESKMDALPTAKNKIRREEILRSFETLCDYASENNVSAVIIAGDMFDTSSISNKTKNRVLGAIEKNSTVDFLYLSGNHDEALNIGEDNVPSNLKFFADEWTKFSYGNVDIYGVNFNGKNTEYIYDTLFCEQNRVNIVALHGQVVGYKTKDGAENISVPRLKNKNIDYLALGHIHSYSVQPLDNRGVFAYSGCLEGRGFDEVGDKGFVLIETCENKVNSNFIKWNKRNYVETEFVLTAYDKFFIAETDIINQLQKLYSNDCVIKLVLKGEISQDFIIDLDSLEYKLNQQFFFVKIKNKTKIKIKETDYALDKTTRGEFVRTVLALDIEEDLKNKIIATGLRALKGEEL